MAECPINYWRLGEIKRYLREGNPLRGLRSIRDTVCQILKVREKLEETDDEVTYDKIANETNIAVSEVAYALDAISGPVSLYESVYNKFGDTLLCWTRYLTIRTTTRYGREKPPCARQSNALNSTKRKFISSDVSMGKPRWKSPQKSAFHRLKLVDWRKLLSNKSARVFLKRNVSVLRHLLSPSFSLYKDGAKTNYIVYYNWKAGNGNLVFRFFYITLIIYLDFNELCSFFVTLCNFKSSIFKK